MKINFPRTNKLLRLYWRATYLLDPFRLYRVTKHVLLNPSNKLHIRNTPRTWCDRSDRIFHATFSMFCDFVEKEHGGVDKLDEDIAYWEKTYPNPTDRFGCWVEEKKEMSELYKWYTGIDWDNLDLETKEYKDYSAKTSIDIKDGLIGFNSPGYTEEETTKIVLDNADAENRFEELCTENAIRVLKLRQHFWT